MYLKLLHLEAAAQHRDDGYLLKVNRIGTEDNALVLNEDAWLSV